MHSEGSNDCSWTRIIIYKMCLCHSHDTCHYCHTCMFMCDSSDMYESIVTCVTVATVVPCVTQFYALQYSDMCDSSSMCDMHDRRAACALVYCHLSGPSLDPWVRG